MNDMFTRTAMLIGEENVRNLQAKRVGVIGVGGVGGTALECLVRSGVGNIVIVDFDVVDISNINRQLLFTQDDVGKSKVEVAKKRMLQINPHLQITAIDEELNENVNELLGDIELDMIIDAIDNINSKVYLVQYCLGKKIPFVCSLGMANRLDPSQVVMTRLDKTFNCPLAKKFRALLRQNSIDLKQINCAFSREEPIIHAETPSSMMMVPSSAGLNLAAYVIKYLIKRRE